MGYSECTGWIVRVLERVILQLTYALNQEYVSMSKPNRASSKLSISLVIEFFYVISYYWYEEYKILS